MHSELTAFWQEAPDDPFDVLFEQAPVLMHSIDAGGCLIQVSRYWAALLGYDRAEMIGRPSTDFLSSASRLKARSEILPEFMKSGTIHDVSYDFVAKSGDLIAVRLSATSVLDGEGNIERSLAILFDNRKTVAAEAALRAKAAEAEAANKAKSRFLSAMSYEVRTPMNAIMGFAELLKLSGHDAKTIGYADAILTAGGSLMALLNDLLELNQPEETSDRPIASPVDLHLMLVDTTDWWRAEAVRKGLDLSLGIDVNVPPVVDIDAPRIQKVLNNLLGNAVKFTETGHVKVQVTRNPDAGMLMFSVADTGPGLSGEVLARLEQPFEDVGNEFEKERGGWGLGLSVCRKTARQLDGSFSIQNRNNGGCLARFTVPARASTGASPPPDDMYLAAPGSAGPREKHILIAEDNALNRGLMRDLLEQLGCRVTVAHDGVEAVELAGQGGFDAILMDISMPQLDGVAAAELIQGLPPPASDVPIVACTAHVDDKSQARYRRAGMAGFLPKPVRADDLERLLADVVDEAAQARAN